MFGCRGVFEFSGREGDETSLISKAVFIYSSAKDPCKSLSAFNILGTLLYLLARLLHSNFKIYDEQG